MAHRLGERVVMAFAAGRVRLCVLDGFNGDRQVRLVVAPDIVCGAPRR